MQWPIRLLFGFVLVFAITPTVIADEYCCYNVNYFGIRVQPSNALLNHVIIHHDSQGCVAAGTGMWLNCSFDFKILGLADLLPSYAYLPSGYSEELITGGHYHYDDRPLVYPNNESSLLSIDTGTIFQQTGLEITGQTDSQDTQVLYPIPEEGGIIAVQDDIYSPFGWVCAYFCFLPNDFRWVEEYEIGNFEPGHSDTALVRLPQEGDDYVVADNDGAHTDLDGYAEGTYLTPEAEKRLLEIAYAYHKLAKAKLSINDMSLPLGGLFDINDNWQPPHKGHRDGIAVDINHHDGNGNSIVCRPKDNGFSELLKRAVNGTVKISNGIWFTRYFCEPDGNIHINLFDPDHPPREL